MSESDGLLHTPSGAEALAAAMAEPDPGSLGAATRLRQHFAPELAAEALAQAALRRKARTKFGDAAAQMFFTAHGLEQATRPEVSAWRAERLVSVGITHVVDLGCGIGADSMAFRAAGLRVTAVELDPVTAEHARANLALARGPLDKLGERALGKLGQRLGTAAEPVEAPFQVITGDAVTLAPELLAGVGPETCVFIDPARRTDAGRTWRVEQFTPPWQFVLDLLAGPHSTVVKLGPGVPRELLPDGIACDFVSHRGDVVEASLWQVPGAEPVQRAVLLPEGATLTSSGVPLTTGPVGRYLHEPDGAVIRARALDAIDPRLRLLDDQTAYLTSDEPVTSPFVTSFEVLDVLDLNQKVLKAWVREHNVGTLEIKKRGIDIDPAEFRKRLQPKGSKQATLVLARTIDGARALVVQRI